MMRNLSDRSITLVDFGESMQRLNKSCVTIRCIRASIGFAVLFSLASLCAAQVDRSGLTGRVTDPSGSLLPQAHVTVVENATGLRRESSSDASGFYSVLQLPVGTYTVIIEHPGFESVEFLDVQQVIGRTRTLDATLPVAGDERHVEVSVASTLLDRNTAAVTGLIENTQADQLPLNGRDWSNLTAFVPGAIDTGGGNQRSVRFAGRGLDDSNFTYDGVDATNVVNQTQRPWVRLAIPLDAITEFRVDTLTATAEEGATGGAQLDVTSRSGTNHFHGRLFEYLRNDVFDAPEPEWASNGEAQQPLRLNQFGGSLNGPIVRDKTFFFLASEAYRQLWGYPVSGDVPSAALIATVPSSSPVYGIMHAFPGAGPRTILAPTSDPNIDLLTCSCTQVANEASAMLRLDHHFSAKTTGFMRFNYDRAVDTQPLSAAATDLQQRVSTPVNGALELLHIFSPSMANEAKFGFNRATSNSYNYSDTGSIYQIAIATGPGPGFVTENYSYNSIYVGNTFSGIDNFTWIHGRHTLKAGAEIRHIQLNQNYGEHGKVTFSTVEQLAANQVKNASLTGALPINDMRKNDIIGYVQDEFKMRPNLTLNLGLRYTVFQIFNEANGKANPFDFATCGAQGFCGVGASFGNQNYGDIDPRVGVIWSPDKSGKTIVRAGFGTYHEDGQLDDQNLPAKNEIPSYSVKSTNSLQVTYPVDPYFTGPGTLSPNAEQRDRKDTYVEQWDFSVQRELPANFVGTISYLGSHGVHLLETNVVNLIDPATGVVQYPAFAPAIGWRGSIGMSSYNGLSVALRRPFSNGLLVTANYAYTHEIDNGSNGSGDGDEISPQNPLCLACDRASGAWDARHVINGNAVYQLPFGLNKPMLNDRGIASAIAGNWEVTTTALARTGFPVNVLLPSSYTAPDGASGTERPDLVPGVSLTPPGGKSVGQWLNPAAFAYPAGEFGTAPRNFLRGPGTWQIDLGTGKTIPIRESSQVQFRAEFFNIFNHPQLGQPQATCDVSSSAPTGCSAGFGTIINTVNLNTAIVSPITPVGSGTPREIQFALRFDF
ncbi:carboxypeptidase regulatory-like domain-containing protein [Acidicapsa dinghuensis]|uniref:Carboxypeptidase regulatory-like domain-containing protein n=1 Tax=Acidicapsa dinghuensis TaxID=2218256 RepID=A0ABW1EH59_9BACT|nr:carboxypeptidase regulatory-like domain-containing protein [Acidicapsa dinghuensis]